MISDYTTYKSYFEDLATSHVDIKSFVSGDSDSMLEQLQKDTLDYPALILESPDIRPTGSEDEARETWSGAIEIVKEAARDDSDTEEAHLQDCLEIIRDIYKKLIDDGEEHNLTIDIPRMVMNPVRSVLLDNCWGWRLDFSFQIETSFCPNEEKFQ